MDANVPFEFANVAVLLRPVLDADDPVIDEIQGFFAPDDESTPFLVVSATPTPSFEARGGRSWAIRRSCCGPRAPPSAPRPDGLEIVPVTDAAAVEAFDLTMIEAYPVPEMHGRRYFGDGVLEADGWHMWLAMLDGEPVGTAAAHVNETFVDVEWISARPECRGRGVGAALTWAATLVAPELPAMLIASDPGQPVYERMGYLRLTRFTLWIGARRV